MTLIETDTIAAIIARLKSFLPAEMIDSVIAYPDRPEEITEDVIKTMHPKGLYMVDFIDSEADGGEVMIFGVYTVAIGLAQTVKLTRAAKMIVAGLAPFGGHQLALHKDQFVKDECGVIMRLVSFSLNNPTLPLSDTKITAKIAELEL